MKKTRNKNEPITQTISEEIDTLYTEKSGFTSATVLHPDFKVRPKTYDIKSLPTHEQIAVRAYDLWQKKGSLSNQEENCWLKAEMELNHEV